MTTDRLFVIYSNLGIGGIPTRLVQIINFWSQKYPSKKIFVYLKKRKKFDLCDKILNKNVSLLVFSETNWIQNSFFFVLWIWLNIFINKPTEILTFISPYAIPVLLSKIIFFWRNTKIVVNEGHHSSSMVKEMNSPLLQKMGIRFLYPYANKIIVPTNVIKKDLMNNFKIPLGKIVIIPNWSKYASLPMKNYKKNIDIIYIGRLEKKKRILEMVQIVASLIKEKKNNITFYILGEGSELQVINEYISGNKLENNIKIYPANSSVEKYLYKSKILLFNSQDKTEGFPVSILDAMSCGCVVIASFFSGIEEVIEHNKNGFIVNEKSEMLKSIIYILENFSKTKDIRKRAKKIVTQKYSDRNIIQYIKAF